MVWIYTIASVIIISLVSLVGIITFSINDAKLRKILFFFVSFGAGALLGGAFIHLLPESIELNENSSNVWIFGILAGLIVFFVLEKFVKWFHCHHMGSCEHDHPKSLSTMNIVGDGFHNFIDGVVIAASFLVSIPLGIATSIAVLIHEIPQEIGDYAILLHAGLTKKKALMFNLLSALMAVLGAVIMLSIQFDTDSFTKYIIPFTAGGFIYIGASDLIPEMHKDNKTSKSIWQVVGLILGIYIMYLMTFLEVH